MSLVEADILSTPAVWRQTLAEVPGTGGKLASLFGEPMVFLGSGSSYDVGTAGASLYEAATGVPAQAILPSEYQPRPDWSHLAISRTGQTTELVQAMRRARDAGGQVGLIVGDPGSPAEEQADVVLHLDFAPEQGVIQTRFITASLLALRLLIEGSDALLHLPDQLEQRLGALDLKSLTSFRHLVFLGRRWRYGLALSAALTIEETALLPAQGYQTLDYRHGPIATADQETLVWTFDPPGDTLAGSVLDDVGQTGATVVRPVGDPLLELVAAQLLAVGVAEARGINPDQPRHLARAIVLTDASL